MPNSAHEKFTAYYHEYKDKIFNYLMYRLNHDRDICEELLMDIILKAYEKFADFDSEKGSFKTWIFTIAHNHLINHWRDRKNISSLDELEESGLQLATVDIKDDASGHFDKKVITTILEKLNASNREIISLRYLSELSYKEIADVTGKNEGAIRTGLSRALDQFKNMYQKFYE